MAAAIRATAPWPSEGNLKEGSDQHPEGYASSLLCPLCRHARHQRCVELLPRETLTLAIQHIQDSQRIQACFDVLDRSSSPIAEEELFCDWCSALLAADP